MTSAGWSRTAPEALARALTDAHQVAAGAAGDLLASVPDTGDPATGRAVDAFVEEVSRALHELDRALADSVDRLGGSGLPRRDVTPDVTPVAEQWRGR